jgi:sirohydrochlorin ferrochelatase
LVSIGDRLQKLCVYGACSSALLLPNQVQERWDSLLSKYPKNKIVVVALFLSEGYFTKEVIPRRLEGMECLYNGRTLMPHPKAVNWIVRQTQEWLKGLEH